MVRRLGLFTLFLLLTAFFLVLVSVAHNLDDKQSSYQYREGTWPVFEQERHLLLLREYLYRISLGDTISVEDYQFRLGVALDRINQSKKFFDRSEYPTEHLDVQYKVVELVGYIEARHKSFLSGKPSPNEAKDLLPLLDDAIIMSHDLVNFRRDDTFKNNRAIFESLNLVRTFEIGTVIIMIILGAWLIFSERRYAQQSRDLAVANMRATMARDIHDSLGSHLHGAITIVSALKQYQGLSPQIQRMLDMLSTAVTHAHREMRRAISILNQSDYSINRAQHLEQMITEMIGTEYYGMILEVVVDGISRPISIKMVDELMKVIQEALTNAKKHANATNVKITLIYNNPSVLEMEIVDNGVGMQMNNGHRFNGTGNGLKNMKSRIELIGGVFDLVSIDQGVKLWISIPA